MGYDYLAGKLELFSEDEEDSDSVIGDEFDEDVGDDLNDSNDDIGPHDDEDNEEEEEDDDDESDGELEIEEESRRLDRLAAKRQAEAEAEMAQLASATGPVEGLELPFVSGEEAEGVAPDLPAIKARISDIVQTLDAFATRRDSRYSRKDYTDQLKHDLVVYYDYNEFMIETLFNLFSAGEAVELIKAFEVGRARHTGLL